MTVGASETAINSTSEYINYKNRVMSRITGSSTRKQAADTITTVIYPSLIRNSEEDGQHRRATSANPMLAVHTVRHRVLGHCFASLISRRGSAPRATKLVSLDS